jgi:hypothetical protein
MRRRTAPPTSFHGSVIALTRSATFKKIGEGANCGIKPNLAAYF